MGRRPRAHNETLIELFLDMIAAERGASTNTLDAYRRDLADFSADLSGWSGYVEPGYNLCGRGATAGCPDVSTNRIMARVGSGQAIWSQGRWEWTAPAGTTIVGGALAYRTRMRHAQFFARVKMRAAGDWADLAMLQEYFRTATDGWEILGMRLRTQFSNNIRNDFGFLNWCEDQPREPHELEQLAAAALRLAARAARDDQQILERRQLGKDANHLERAADATPRDLPGPETADRLAAKAHPSRVEALDPRDAVEQRGLPRAVGADEAVDASGLERERDVVDGRHAAEALAHPFDREHRRHAYAPRRAYSRCPSRVTTTS